MKSTAIFNFGTLWTIFWSVLSLNPLWVVKVGPLHPTPGPGWEQIFEVQRNYTNHQVVKRWWLCDCFASTNTVSAWPRLLANEVAECWKENYTSRRHLIFYHLPHFLRQVMVGKWTVFKDKLWSTQSAITATKNLIFDKKYLMWCEERNYDILPCLT